ncbi:hypothetical protein KHA80_20695 [Anaerobacillus sp. HL2]|nr:hypothetical protein KHA80_20695 [Anaerobacillus sp. HL2]
MGDVEPVISKVLHMGVDLISFSGDKLLGWSSSRDYCRKERIDSKIEEAPIS